MAMRMRALHIPRTIRSLRIPAGKNYSWRLQHQQVPPCSIRRITARNVQTNSADDNVSSKFGDHQAYESYKLAVQDLEHLFQEQERIKNEQMYQAWQRSQSKTNSGVVVIKTLVKETHKQQQSSEKRIEELKTRAQEFLELAGQQGDSAAMVELGNQALENAHKAWRSADRQSCREALDRALDWYRRSNSPEGYFNLGHLLWTGYPDQVDESNTIGTIILKADKSESMLAFQNAIELGDTDAMYFFGVAGLGSVDDEDNVQTIDHATLHSARQGLELVERAASQGHGGALHYLAVLHLNGHRILNIPACEAPEFIRLLDSAASAEYADALFLRGHCLYHGEHGYQQDIRKALDDFLLAADRGNADAAVSAGAMLHKGLPPFIPRNQERAFALYQHAGELGSSDGWRNVCACYASGEGVARNLHVAKYIAETMLKDGDDDRV
jgi:TPR repeat protein